MTLPSREQGILLVEDNPLDLDLTLRALHRHPIVNRIDVARDGEEALSWIERWENGAPLPLVILLDLKLPKLDGFEVLRELRARPVCATVPVVILTSSREDRDIARAYQLHTNSYIVKPVDFQKFTEVMTQIQHYWCLINQPPY